MAMADKCPCGRTRQQVYREMMDVVRFMEQDPDNLVYRRFEKLHLYNLLFLQHELSQITETVVSYEENPRLDNMEKLGEILPRLNRLLKTYHEAFSTFNTVQNTAHVPRYLQRNLRKIAEVILPLKHEYDIGNGWDDLAPIHIKDKGAIHRFVDDTEFLSKRFPRFPKDKPDSSLYYYSERAVRLLEQIVIHSILFALIAVPITSFVYIHSILGKIMITLGCITVAIPTITGLLPQSERNQVALVFGYAAILVAFSSQGS